MEAAGVQVLKTMAEQEEPRRAQTEKLKDQVQESAQTLKTAGETLTRIEQLIAHDHERILASTKEFAELAKKVSTSTSEVLQNHLKQLREDADAQRATAKELTQNQLDSLLAQQRTDGDLLKTQAEAVRSGLTKAAEAVESATKLQQTEWSKFHEKHIELEKEAVRKREAASDFALLQRKDLMDFQKEERASLTKNIETQADAVRGGLISAADAVTKAVGDQREAGDAMAGAINGATSKITELAESVANILQAVQTTEQRLQTAADETAKTLNAAVANAAQNLTRLESDISVTSKDATQSLVAARGETAALRATLNEFLSRLNTLSTTNAERASAAEKSVKDLELRTTIGELSEEDFVSDVAPLRGVLDTAKAQAATADGASNETQPSSAPDPETEP